MVQKSTSDGDRQPPKWSCEVRRILLFDESKHAVCSKSNIPLADRGGARFQPWRVPETHPAQVCSLTFGTAWVLVTWASLDQRRWHQRTMLWSTRIHSLCARRLAALMQFDYFASRPGGSASPAWRGLETHAPRSARSLSERNGCLWLGQV